MKLLSLDTSTTSTGYAVYEMGELIEYGCLTHDKGTHLKQDEKMQKMVEMIYALINRIKPFAIVVELTAVARNVQVQRNLTMILGAIYGYSVSHDLYFFTYRPSEWRNRVTPEKKPRKREELKEWSKNKVKEIFKIELDSDDASDAILIGYAYYMEFGKAIIKV